MAVSAGERSAAQGAASSPDARSSVILGEIPGPDPTARRVQRRRAIRRTLIASDLVAFTLAALVAQQVSNLKIQAVPSMDHLRHPAAAVDDRNGWLRPLQRGRAAARSHDPGRAGPAFTFITIGTWSGSSSSRSSARVRSRSRMRPSSGCPRSSSFSADARSHVATFAGIGRTCRTRSSSVPAM